MGLFNNEKNDPDAVTKLREDLDKRDNTIELFQERLAELELSLEDMSWSKLDMETDKEFSKTGLNRINKLARLYWLKNPLIRRAVLTQTQYVFGQGMSIEGEDSTVNEVIQKFFNDKDNKDELTAQQALSIKETEMQLFGNLFFVLFVKPQTGQVKVRTISMDEITEVVTDPDDKKRPLYYKRVYVRDGKQVTIYYPDWNNERPGSTYKGVLVEKAKIFHVSVNKLSDMKYGVSEVYAALDWAKAYKNFLEDWATVVASYAKFAWKVSVTKGGRHGTAAVKKKLGSTIPEQGYETNPAGTAGGFWAQNEGVNLDPIKASGPSVAASDGDKIIHMVSAATGIFYHYLVGDPSTGNLATAKAMERPMELMFRDRQELWKNIFDRITKYVILQSVKAPKGLIDGRMQRDDDGDYELVLDNNEEGEPMSQTVFVTFPDLLEKDLISRVDAIIKAATLGGGQLGQVIEPEIITRLLLDTLDIDNVEEVMQRMYPDDEVVPGQPPQAEGRRKRVEKVFNEALQELSQAIKEVNERTDKQT